jgi:hypothetical protein
MLAGMADVTNPALSIDTSIPNAARMYDYWLGGKDNFASDRMAAEHMTAAVPQLPWLARENRRFLGRAVRHCANAGVTQFLDIGSGLPTMENVHQVAQRAAAVPRVVYVDNDSVVVSHAQALVAGRQTAAIRGDVTRPDEILSAPEVRHLIDFSQPVAILIVAVLHFILDDADPFGCVARLRDAMAPGSYLVISHVEMSTAHVVGTELRTDTARELAEAHKGMPDNPARTRDEIARFFGDLALVEPGLTHVWEWRPDTDSVAITSDVMTVLGGVARKD